MKKKKIALLAGVVIGVVFSYYIGAMFDFFPFVADDFVVRALGFCTLIICTVIAVCTCILLDSFNKK